MATPTDTISFDFAYGESRSASLVEVDVDFDPHPDPSEVIEGIVLGPSATGKRWEMHVLTIGKWPEVKTETCYKKVRIPFDGWTKVPYPCVWQRTCDKSWYLTIAYSGGGSLPDRIGEIIEECAKLALIPALPLLLAGQPAAAAAAFLEAFKTCLISKGIKELSGWKVGFDARKSCGKWHRI